MKGKVTVTVAAAVSLALAGYCGYAFCVRIDAAGMELYALIPVYIISLLIGAFIAEVLHESGHLIFGLCCRMGMKMPKISLFKSSSVEMFPYGERAMKFRMVVTSAGGLFFGALLIVLGACALALPQISVILCVPMPYAVYSFIVNAAPVEYASGKTDGLIICELLANAPCAVVMLAILRIQGLIHTGVRLQDIEESRFFDVPQLPEDDINFIILTQLRYEYYLAKGNDSEAYKYFARYKELLVYLPSAYGARYVAEEDGKQEN